MDTGLEGHCAMVSGGASGIGAAIVRALAAEGASVVVVDRNAEQGGPLAEELRGLFVEADLRNEADCARAVERAVDRFGRLDILVNNAGANDGVGLDQPPERFQESLRQNLFHVFALTHFALPHLKRAEPSGRIVNIGSKVSVTGQGNTSGYAASKGAINALTREWAADLAPYGIRVNAILPAEVLTPMYEQWLHAQEVPSEALQRIEGMVPLGRRMTRPEEIASMAVYLASQGASHVTGQWLFVDGGYTHLDRAL